jgi:FlaG/FlaF family flagellin (archaellin)
MKPSNDTAVSPILGTVLLMILTVVLFAALAAVAFGMTDVIPKSRLVSFTAHQEGEMIYVTYMGGPSQLDVADPGITALVNEQPMTTPFSKTGHIEVGTSAKTLGTLGQDHVTVSVVFKDGRAVTVLDSWV